MSIEFDIMDYEENTTHVATDQDKTVSTIIINVVTGDEIAIVVYDDRTVDIFDSSNNRLIDFFDGTWVPYTAEKGWDPHFAGRKDSYDFGDDVKEEE